MYHFRPSRPEDEIWTRFHRCSACDAVNETATRPNGGRFFPKDPLTSAAGTKYVDPEEGAQGCWACSCPAHRNGGKLGDMDKPF